MDFEVEGFIFEEELSNQKAEPFASFIAGLTSGCAGVLVGQPLDTVKVRLQTASHTSYTNATDCFKKIVTNEGYTALYKGSLPPLLSGPFINAILFFSYNQTSQFLIENRSVKNSGDISRNLTTGETFIAGSIAGAAQTIITIPADNIKTKLQVQVGNVSSKTLMFKGPFDCLKQSIRNQGLKSLTAGASVTLLRDIPALGLYFCTYEQIKNSMKSDWGFHESISSILAGGISGSLSWLVCFPFDAIKSNQQAMLNCLSVEANSMIACGKQMFARNGPKAFFKGLGATLIRAFPVNATIFPVYELTVKLL